MSKIYPIKKPKLSLAQQYKLYLNNGPKPKDKLSNKYNLFNDLNTKDVAAMQKAKDYINRIKHGR